MRVLVVEQGPTLYLCSCIVRSPECPRRKNKKGHWNAWSDEAGGLPPGLECFLPVIPIRLQWSEASSECSPGSLFGMWEGAVSRDENYISTPQTSEQHTITKWLNPPPRPSTVRVSVIQLTSHPLPLDLPLLLSTWLCTLQAFSDYTNCIDNWFPYRCKLVSRCFGWFSWCFVRKDHYCVMFLH